MHMQTILIIDDERQTREVIHQILECDGYTVLQAENGREGMELFNEQPTDLVITDIIMPEQEGFETIRELKKTHPSARIIAISGGGRMCSANYLDMAKKLGAHQILKKPFKRNELLEAVRIELEIASGN